MHGTQRLLGGKQLSVGVFCKEPISADSKFGPFVGDIVPHSELEEREKEIDFKYAWQVSDSKTSKVIHVVNATVPEKGNWMRYVQSARFFEEQNIMSVQEDNEIYYKAIKDIKPGEELLTWFEPSDAKKTRKRKRNSRVFSTPTSEIKGPGAQNSSDADLVGNGKRLRKKKVSEDMLSLDDDDVIFASSGLHHNRIRNNTSALRRTTSVPDGKLLASRKPDAQKNKMQPFLNKTVTPVQTVSNKTVTPAQPVAKALLSSSQQTVPTSLPTPVPTLNEFHGTFSGASFSQTMLASSFKSGKRPKTINQIVDFLKTSKEQPGGSANITRDFPGIGNKLQGNGTHPSRPKQKRSNLVGTAEYMEERLTTDFQFLFQITTAHKTVPVNAPKQMKYACDICESQYRKPLSLKRHVLREHLNHKYLSPEDVSLLDHISALSSIRVEADEDPDADDFDISDPSSNSNSPRVKREGLEEDEILLIKEEIKEIETVARTSDEGKESGGMDVKDEGGANATRSSTPDSNGILSKPKISREVLEQELTSKALEGKKTFSYSGTDTVNDAFRCHLCVQLFPSVEKLKYHLMNDSHRSKGDKMFGCERCSQRFRFRHNYQRHLESHGVQMSEMSTACHICGKKFLNEANMRKHLRFHSGRNFPCKYGCDVVYPNVAELVKHLRAIHPDLPKRSQAALTDMAKKQMEPPHQNGSAEPKDFVPPIIRASPVLEVPSKPKMELLHNSEVKQASESTDTVARKSQEGIMGVHCTICKKKFSTYGSMCRHRRSVHRVVKMSGTFVNVDNTPDLSPAHEEEEEEEEDTSTWDDHMVTRTKHIEANVERMYEDIEREQARRRSGEEFDFSPPPSPTSFYQNVADNIAENLSCYLDGGSDALKSAQQYIKIDDYVPLDEAEKIKSRAVDINWSTYNFPPFFMPVDPVIPLPPSPPPLPPSIKENILVLDDDKTLAYPTRSAVAEREATRRSSVGAAEKPLSGENGRLPRRASIGSFDVQSKDGSKLVRRASVGSFDDQKNTEAGTEGVSGTVRNPVTSQTIAVLGAQNVETNLSDKTEQLSPVQDNNTVVKNQQSSNTAPVSEDDVFDCHGKHIKDVECAPSTDIRDVLNNQSYEKSDESGKVIANENEKLVESVSKAEEKDRLMENRTKQIGDQNGQMVSSEKHEDALTKHPSAMNESCDPLKIDKPSDLCVPADKSASNVQDDQSEVNFDDDILVCKETLSNFSSPDITEMSASRIEDNVSETEEKNEQVEFESGLVKGSNDSQAKDISNYEVSGEKQSDSNIEPTMQTDASKDSGKPEHSSPSLRSNKPPEKPTKDLSEKELEFLSKGIVLYVRGNKEQCTHLADESTVPMRCTESKDEEEYLETLQLAVKKVKAKPAASSQNNPDSDVTADTSKLRSINEERANEKGQNQNETCSIVEESSSNGNTRSETCEGTLQNSDSSDKNQDASVCEKKSSVSTIPSLVDNDKETESKTISGMKVSQSEDADNDDSDLDEEILNLQTKWQLQALQERVAIDRESEEICKRCHPQNTEHGEPCKRTAEDFAKMRFGRKNAIFCVCSFCRRYYYGVDSLLRHQMKKHPSIQCSYFEVENGHGLEMLFYPQPSTRGVLAESILLPPQHVSQETYTCTRCKLTVKQYSRLRAHILNCDPRTPTTPHSRKKKPKSNRHRFMEKMLPDSGSNDAKEKKAAEKSHTVRALNFKSRGQGTVMGLRKKTYPFSSRNHKPLQRPGKKEVTSSAPPQPVGRLPSTRTKTQSWKMSQSVASSASSKSSTSPAKSGRAQKRRNYELLYNPAAHVRRREKTECVDIHQCQGCRLSFRTLPLLERHTKNCTGKDKILSQRHVASKFLDKEGAKKHSCHYCPKRFKYLKGVYNHYNNNFCRVRAERLSGKGLTADDLAHEEQLQASLQQQAWNKMENQDHTDVIQGRAHLHDDGTITHTRKKGGWPKGLKRSNKRRRNGWTCIKRRKPDGDGNESSSSPSKSRSSPRVTASVSSSSSATSAAMSELEARLREPIGVKRKRASRDPSASEDVASSSHVTKHDGKSPAFKQAKLTSPKKKKTKKPEDDLSEAPVIDRMDMEPPAKSREGKQMSPDLEPPILSPVSPSVSTDPQPQSAQSHKKVKRKTVDAATQENTVTLINGGNVVQSTTKDKLWPVSDISSKANNIGKSTNPNTSPQPVVTPHMNLGDGMNTPVFVLEQVTDASGNKAGQYKLVQLKIPTVLPRLNSNQATVLHNITGVKKAQTCSTNTIEQKSLPPNFLFPSLPEQGKNGEGKGEERMESSSNSAGTEQRKDTMKSPSQEPVESGRKARQRKRKKAEDSPATTTIKDLFKNKKSPTRSTSNSNTIKNIDAQCTETSVAASVVGSISSSTPSTSLTSPTYNAPANAVPTLLPGGGITMLPPGAVIAVLPNTSAVLPSTVSTPLSPSSSSVKNVHTLTNSLQGAMPEGKFVLLDPRNLTSLLSSGPAAALSPPTGPKSPNKDGVKGQGQSPVKSGNIKSTAKPQPVKISNLTVKEKKEGKIPVVQPPKPTADIPNFLFDSVGKSEPSPTESSPQSQKSCDKKMATPESVSIQDDEMEKGTGKNKGKKPKRGPPPSMNSPNGSKVKSMTMMTSPGIHTMVSLNVPCTSSSTTNNSQNNLEQTESEMQNQSSEICLKSNITEMKTRSSRAKSDSSGLSDVATAKNSVCDGVKKTTRSAKTKTEGLPDTGGKSVLKDDKMGSEGDMNKGDKSTANKKPVGNITAEKKTVVLNVPVVTKRTGKRASPSADDDDLPLSAVAAKIKDK